MAVSIVIADDHGVLRAGLRTLLGAEPDFKVVGEAASGEEALRVALERRPDIILLDVSMPGVGGLEATKMLKEKLPKTHVLILTVHEDETLLREAIRAGASGYIIKRAVESELIGAIHAVQRGELYVHPARTAAGSCGRGCATSGGSGIADSPRDRRPTAPRTGLHEPADCRGAGPLCAYGGDASRQHHGQARLEEPRRAGSVGRPASPDRVTGASSEGPSFFVVLP
jgi:CheY-like chemotaxis protein